MSSLERALWYGYGLGFEPASFFDGGDAALQETLYSALRGRIEAARSRKTMMEMTFDSASTVLDSSRVAVGVSINPLDTLINDRPNLMLVAVLYEDSVGHPGIGGGDSVYVPIAVDVIGGPWGVPVSLQYATPFDTLLEAPLGDWRRDYLGVAVFVQDTATREVLQSAVMKRIGHRP